jgi:surface carbohydrate biosynthesis protein (TIGR04326 family)
MAVLLIHKDQRVRVSRGKWIYFGQDFLDLLRWESVLGKSQRISYANQLGEASRELRKPFVEWVAKLGKGFGGSLDWWMTPLAGRVVMQTPIYLYLCYMVILKQTLACHDRAEDVLVVCEDWFLLRTFESMLQQERYETRRVGWWRMSLLFIAARGTVRLAGSWIVTLWMHAAVWLAARLTRKSAGPTADLLRKQVVIHTCIDDSCLGNDGTLRDRYFTELPAWLDAHGYEITILPWLCNVRRSVFATIKWLRSSRNRFIIPEDYLRPSDYLKAIRQVIRLSRILHGPQEFSGHCVTPLIQRERIQNLSAGLVRFLLNQPVLERWLQAENRCDIFVDMFENMYSERPQLLALKRFSPGAVTVGYQHATIPRELVGYCLTQDEWNAQVFPQRIVTNGPAATDMLIAQGFPRANVVEGPALRYSALLDSPVMEPANDEVPENPSVLVVLPLDLAASVELLVHLISQRSFLEEKHWTVLLKIHPMMSADKLLSRAGLADLPIGWRWVTGDLENILDQVMVVLGVATGALLDAAIRAVPVICAGRELGFAYNPLEYWSDDYAMCETVLPHRFTERLEEIRQAGNGRERSKAFELSVHLRAGLGQLDDAHFRAFI